MTSHLDTISSGRLARDGLLSAEAQHLAADLLARLEQGPIETVRVVFADQHGLLRGKTVTAASLGSIFRSGLNLPGTLLLKDTSNRTVFPIWDGRSPGVMATMAGAGDMLAVPDPATFRVLPWSPHSAWLFCDPYTRDGQPLPFAPRPTLRRAVDLLAAEGYSLTVGLEVEFHVFARTDASLGQDRKSVV